MSNGRSAVARLDRVAFDYGASSFSYGGSGANDQEGRARASVLRAIEDWIRNTF